MFAIDASVYDIKLHRYGHVVSSDDVAVIVQFGKRLARVYHPNGKWLTTDDEPRLKEVKDYKHLRENM